MGTESVGSPVQVELCVCVCVCVHARMCMHTCAYTGTCKDLGISGYEKASQVVQW